MLCYRSVASLDLTGSLHDIGLIDAEGVNPDLPPLFDICLVTKNAKTSLDVRRDLHAIPVQQDLASDGGVNPRVTEGHVVALGVAEFRKGSSGIISGS